MRIASVYWPEIPPAHYRAIIPMAALRRRGHDVTMFPQVEGEEISLDELARHDLVYVHRLIVNDDDAFVERLHEKGVPVCFDNDDDVTATTNEQWEALPGVTARNVAPSMREAARAFALLPSMDLVTTPSDVLAERFRAAGARDVQVIENYVPPEFLRIVPAGRPGFIVGWHASFEHHWDRMALGIERMLAEILEQLPHVHVVTLGVDLGIDSNRYTFGGEAQLEALTNEIADFDIGIAPLSESAFNEAKSSIKVREYAAAGVPWLASARGPYLGLGKAHGGRLVEDGDWLAALTEMIRSPVDRALLRRRAKSWTRREVIDEMAWLWEDAFLELLEPERSAGTAA
jgi:glycosyltransferase involved in cell wall biosynthesis